MPESEIKLLPVLRSHKTALAVSSEQLASILSLRIPAEWPHFPEAFDPHADIVESEWSGYFFVSEYHQSVVGNGGFFGPPIEGQVEIGYEIAPEFQNKGLATAAVRAMLSKAFENSSVQRVVAHTLAERNASNAVLVKAGLSFVSELANEEVGRVWRWQVTRAREERASPEA
jgi:[ribosomal protein S5]-alanine N-acetyltransferase